MTINANTRVPYTMENIERCKCPKCPVQARDECVRNKVLNLETEIQNAGKEGVPAPEKIPGVYCSTGNAICENLDPNQQCICKTCEVWANYVLEAAVPMMYFCNIGKAD